MDKARIMEMLQQLTAADGPAGVEMKVAGLVQTLAAPYANETHVDALGTCGVGELDQPRKPAR